MFYVTAFRCAYCYFMNPARKTRPQAPRLPEFSFERRLRSESPETQSSAATETPEDSDAPEGISCCWQPVTLIIKSSSNHVVILSCHVSISLKTAAGKPPRGEQTTLKVKTCSFEEIIHIYYLYEWMLYFILFVCFLDRIVSARSARVSHSGTPWSKVHSFKKVRSGPGTHTQTHFT